MESPLTELLIELGDGESAMRELKRAYRIRDPRLLDLPWFPSTVPSRMILGSRR